MHRTLEVSVPADRTDLLIDHLYPYPEVIGLAVLRGASLKPKGDILTLSVLNRGADKVLQQIQAICTGSEYSIATSEQASLIDPQQDELIEDDYDEAIWEEMETGLRHNGCITANYLSLMAIGGAVAAVGLVSDPAPQAISFVAAAVIAPGFDPLAKLSLGITLRKPGLIKKGIKSTLAGYALLVVAAAAAFWIMQWTGSASVIDFTTNPEIKHLSEPTSREMIMSVCGALAGGIMVASYRESFIAGPIIALAFIHASATIGVGLASGEWVYAVEGLERFGLDILFIVAGCWFVFVIKQLFVHKRKPIV